ncbi:MAG: GntR family transcriptional regulator [Sphaerochaetaceae bacterium]|nr:GntR family transcriptional regulator [Sphaerochaetaceae bacterium]
MKKKDTVLEDIRNKITTGEMAPGKWITEREICEIYDMSRTPVREILWKLAALNLIEVVGEKGYRIKKYTIEDIIEVFNARKAIEGECARLACISDDEGYDAKVQDLIHRLNAVSEDNTSELIKLGSQVHVFIQEQSKNKYLKEFNQRIYSLVSIIRNTTKSFQPIEKKSKDAHIEILNALARRDGNACAIAMRKHLQDTCVAMVNNNCINLLGNDDFILDKGENV